MTIAEYLRTITDDELALFLVLLMMKVSSKDVTSIEDCKQDMLKFLNKNIKEFDY